MDIFAAAIVALLPLQSVNPAPTYESGFLVHDGSAYVPSPVYPLAQEGDRVTWSADSSRAAFVAPVQYTPARFAQAAEKGEVDHSESVFVWNADSGRVKEVAKPRDDTQGYDKIEFVGLSNDLVISTYWGSTVKESRQGVIYLRDGGSPQELPIGETSSLGIAISRTRTAVLLMTDHGAFHIDAGSVQEVQLPEEVTAIWGLAADDTAQLVGQTDDRQARYYSYDFATRRTVMQSENKEIQRRRQNGTPPFHVDIYEPSGLKRSTEVTTEDLSAIDAMTRKISDEDGGLRMDLVERVGEKRRRFPFIWEMSRYFFPSPNGLSVAFISQGALCVRSMIRCDKESTAKLLGTAAAGGKS